MFVPPWLDRLRIATAGLSAADLQRIPAPEDVVGRPSAVLMLFAGSEFETADVLLLQRAATLRSHAGQVAFPGGATDAGDATPASTALREAADEVGLIPASAVVLAELPQLYLHPSRFLVTPVLAYWTEPHPVGVLDADEVAAVQRVPLHDLVAPANRFTVAHPSGFSGPGFAVDGMFIWGFTAGLLSALLLAGGFDEPWDERAQRPLPV
jgi:8-oxo-dGTP pyrophosphatase MutT (NUDIX family)